MLFRVVEGGQWAHVLARRMTPSHNAHLNIYTKTHLSLATGPQCLDFQSPHFEVYDELPAAPVYWISWPVLCGLVNVNGLAINRKFSTSHEGLWPLYGLIAILAYPCMRFQKT